MILGCLLSRLDPYIEGAQFLVFPAQQVLYSHMLIWDLIGERLLGPVRHADDNSPLFLSECDSRLSAE